MALLLFSMLLAGCSTAHHHLTPPPRTSAVTGREFYREAVAMAWRQRDSLALQLIRSGDVPSFLAKLSPVNVTITDSATGRTIHATYFVTPDYLSVGTNDDWARINITPMAAQQVADLFHCFLPTKKMVDDIYKAAKVKLEPVPMYAFRDSTITMWQHHLIVEGQRKGRTGLIAGIKKDLVLSGKLLRDPKKDRVAIYGWHQPDGKPIQPLYTGHVNWWVDYSQGTRLVYEQIKVGNTWMNYQDVLKDPVLQKLLCDEMYCDCFRYEQ